jgi:hypothetical protein
MLSTFKALYWAQILMRSPISKGIEAALPKPQIAQDRGGKL